MAPKGITMKNHQNYLSLVPLEERDVIFQTLLNQYGFTLQNVEGDGNCGIYSLMLGLKARGLTPHTMFLSANNMAGAMLYIRKKLQTFMANNRKEIWTKIPKDKDGDVPKGKSTLCTLKDDVYERYEKRLYQESISVERYFYQLRRAKTEHLEDYGLIAAAALYKVTISVVTCNMEEFESFTSIYDGKDYEKLKTIDYHKLKGVRCLSTTEYPSLIELFHDGGHYMYLIRETTSSEAETLTAEFSQLGYETDLKDNE